MKENNKTCPICGRELVALEYNYNNPAHYDGISEYFCPQPSNKNKEQWHYREGRWSGKILKSGDFELPFGKQQ